MMEGPFNQSEDAIENREVTFKMVNQTIMMTMMKNEEMPAILTNLLDQLYTLGLYMLGRSF